LASSAARTENTFIFAWPPSTEIIEIARIDHEEDAMTIRVAAIEVSHWHALNDAAYLRHLVAMPDVKLVAIQDSDVGLVARRAAEVPAFQTHKAPNPG
jgi:hypothetical protein